MIEPRRPAGFGQGLLQPGRLFERRVDNVDRDIGVAGPMPAAADGGEAAAAELRHDIHARDIGRGRISVDPVR